MHLRELLLESVIKVFDKISAFEFSLYFNRLFNRHYAVEDAHWRMNDGGISSGLSFT